MYMCACVYIYIYPVHNPKMMHQKTSVSEYSVPIVNPERSLKRNSKSWLILLS